MKIEGLSDLKKRELIAEFCGWLPVGRKTFNGLPMWQKEERFAAVRVAPCDKAEYLPDYLNSLDAMHEAEKSINPCDWGSYTMELRRIVQRDCNKPECYVIGTERAQLIADFWFYHATSRQRADAILLTLPESQNNEEGIR